MVNALIRWGKEKVTLFNLWDITFTKLAAFFATLFLARLFPETLLAYDLAWYLILAIVFAMPVCYKVLLKQGD